MKSNRIVLEAPCLYFKSVEVRMMINILPLVFRYQARKFKIQIQLYGKDFQRASQSLQVEVMIARSVHHDPVYSNFQVHLFLGRTRVIIVNTFTASSNGDHNYS